LFVVVFGVVVVVVVVVVEEEEEEEEEEWSLSCVGCVRVCVLKREGERGGWGGEK
jgi:hypothetical protein